MRGGKCRQGLTDAHCHMGTEKELTERIREGIRSVICAGSPKEAERLNELIKRPGGAQTIIPAAGLHPWNSGRYRTEEMFPFMEKWTVTGEIGMDTLWCDVPLKVQREAFECQLAFAMERRKPVVLHTKDQEEEIARIIRRYPNRYLVHWYSCEKYLEQYLEQDCFFSIGPDVSWNPIVQKVARCVPKDRILIETDGLGAVEWAWEERKKRGIMESQLHMVMQKFTVRGSLEQTLQEAARLREMDTDALLRDAAANLRRFTGRETI